MFEGGKNNNKTWHTRSIPSLPQKINLFGRAARLKIGTPQTTALELIAQILGEHKKTPEIQSCFYSVVLFSYRNISLVYLPSYFVLAYLYLSAAVKLN